MPVRSLLILCILAAPALAGPPAGGRFTVFNRGREVGHETVTIHTDRIESMLVYEREGSRWDYSLSLTFDPPTIHSRDGEAIHLDLPKVPVGTLVLNEPFAAPWLLVAARYDRQKGGRQEFPAYFAKTKKKGRIVVTGREDQAVEIDGRVHLATRLLAVPDQGGAANLWLDEDGTVLVCARSIAGISAVRGSRAVLGLKPGSDPPDPPEVKSVRVRFAANGITLAGTLSRPKEGDGPYPAVLLLSGSGPQDRNGNAPATELQWNYLHSFAMALAKKGIASLRYDERGVAKSGGVFANAGVTEFLADARSALAYVRSRDDIRPKRVGVLGHSEGALLAARLAAGGGVKAVVLVGAPAEPLDRILLSQFAARLSRNGITKGRAQRILGDFRAFFEHIRLSEADVVTWSGRTRDVRWLREHMSIEPKEIYEKVPVPALVLHGGRDLQVSAAQGERVARAIPAATFVLFPGLDHFLVPGKGTIEDYADAVRRVDPAALTRMSDWVRRELR